MAKLTGIESLSEVDFQKVDALAKTVNEPVLKKRTTHSIFQIIDAVAVRIYLSNL